MSATRSIYKVLRSVLFSAVLVVTGLLAILYVVVSVPSVQRTIKNRAERELTSLFGGQVTISSVDIFPFNEVRLHGVSLYTPEGKRCLSVGRIGAGIDLWTLISSGEIEIAYAEIIAMNARISQPSEGAPLNIQFIIDALSNKEKKTPPPQFRVVIHNIVIRKSTVSFDREYMKRQAAPGHFDFNHIELSDFRADVALPLIANDDFSIDLRRLAFDERSGFSVKGLSLQANITPHNISFSDFTLRTANSVISISDQSLDIRGYNDILNALRRESHTLAIFAGPLYLSDFSSFWSRLSEFDSSFTFEAHLRGKADDIHVDSFRLWGSEEKMSLSLAGRVCNVSDPSLVSGELDRFGFDSPAEFNQKLIGLFPAMPDKIKSMIASVGDLSVKTAGRFDLGDRHADLLADISTSAGDIGVKTDLAWNERSFTVSDFSAKTETFDIGHLLADNRLGCVALDASGNFSVRGKQIEGKISAFVPFVDFNTSRFENISVEAEKIADSLTAHAEISDRFAVLTADTDCLLNGPSSQWNLKADIEHILPGCFGIGMFGADDRISGDIDIYVVGDTPDNFSGMVAIRDLDLVAPKSIHFDRIDVSADIEDNRREYKIDTDFLSGTVSGDFRPTSLVGMVRNLVSSVVPAFVNPGKTDDTDGQYADFNFSVLPSDDLYSVLRSSVRPGVPVMISGRVDGSLQSCDVSVDAPYIIKGRDKLIKNTKVSVSLRDQASASVKIKTDFPMKNDYARLDVSVDALSDHLDADMSWVMDKNHDNTGSIGVGLDIARRPLDRDLSLVAMLGKSGFRLNGADWTISPARIEYSDKALTVSGLRVAHGLQFVDISGKASADPMDVLTAELAGIDLEYIFNILNINHVDFGGIATGTAHVSNLFTKSPIARTDGLFVRNLAYNGSVLGDGQLESHWDNDEGMVAINADITAQDSSSATVRGGVYVTRDSLSFDFHADRLDIEFLQPFMSGFTSKVTGKASGDLKLYGTFSDIDLAGKAFADTITMKVDYTNVCYSGSDTVYFSPGRIYIPRFRLYDKYGNSSMMRGEVRHNFLKDPSFSFDMSGARHLLVYDTGPKMNPRWYGHIFADGSASLRGRPGLISLDINMQTADNSEFTLVLDETQTAVDYTFLTFSDRRKELLESQEVKEVSFENSFRKNMTPSLRERPDLFVLDIAVDVTPGADLVIVMDPQAGDKIRAEGRGALQMHYDSDTDDMTLYGKYTLDRGDYNFSLQDLILKNFKIRPGSSISFNGDPLGGILDITAAYRVNTNLADLDRSFQSDPDLNRTSVPVDALLNVTGDIQAPEINFDLKFPTVTSEVERKVKSIISTDEMMNRQIIYLLALNRFYTPEYMGAEQGGELASVASSTLSSQLQNIIGSLTDKFSVAPSFKSEKSDLSDMEVDVALSSSLFDNRLLLNGNLGYRDRSTSQTTFIGDFDLEYLLSRDGRLRLKAYNHFNDASYYLRSALTTQGIGIIYRKDFDDPFTFIKRMFRRKKKKEESVKSDKENLKKSEIIEY